METKPNIIIAYILGVLAVIGFGGTLPVTKIALNDFSPEFITFARSLIAAILAIILLNSLHKKLLLGLLQMKNHLFHFGL